MNESGNAKKCTKQKGHYSRKRKCWRKKVKAAAVDIVAGRNLVEIETELVVPEDKSVLEEAEISTVSISKIINVETETHDNEDKVTGYRMIDRNFKLYFPFTCLPRMFPNRYDRTGRFTPKKERISKLFISKMQ